jgi:hypothetical protein
VFRGFEETIGLVKYISRFFHTVPLGEDNLKLDRFGTQTQKHLFTDKRLSSLTSYRSVWGTKTFSFPYWSYPLSKKGKGKEKKNRERSKMVFIFFVQLSEF